ncbi:putative transposase [Rickettsia bellii str. RML An4]|uniref:Putative transposase n=1 Tax=Rickettsia bellii str. RML An4 TaxID=1359193 RepID=A0A0F3QDK4_RICBE|nr:hypothetical protein [Rickettsia bellii]KJV90231.1 putative transposase [Rickettsia bellii str. RML An4]
MIKYHKHIGIDIGKYNFVVGIEGIKDTKEDDYLRAFFDPRND